MLASMRPAGLNMPKPVSTISTFALWPHYLIKLIECLFSMCRLVFAYAVHLITPAGEMIVCVEYSFERTTDIMSIKSWVSHSTECKLPSSSVLMIHLWCREVGKWRWLSLNGSLTSSKAEHYWTWYSWMVMLQHIVCFCWSCPNL